MSNEITAQEKASFNEYNAVVEALQPYIQSAKDGNSERIRTAFYDHAHIVGSMNGTFLNMDADSFKDAIQGGGESPEVQHKIAWVDISGPAAAVKLEFINWIGFRFTDFLVLYKNDGKWKISAKVYDSHEKN
ncbi:MAG: nuclear transport factor 2 family protein [Gammaproteobacteria bacterium]|nr:nuclear transport factor 2 family protein [Gammaproteobacteria bacterium]MBL4900892.1 nuclear transport factor 2 family protein [Colwellia sp.]